MFHDYEWDVRCGECLGENKVAGSSRACIQMHAHSGINGLNVQTFQIGERVKVFFEHKWFAARVEKIIREGETYGIVHANNTSIRRFTLYMQ